MIDKSDVEIFLKAFFLKMDIWQIIYRDDRGKNTQALIELEITPAKRKEIIRSLKVTDYSDGPIDDLLYGGSGLWVFGREIKGNEVYIKITMGSHNLPVICISFHLSEHKMIYPFKKPL